MTGKASAPATPPAERASWLVRLAQRQQRYLAVDGGAGAHLLAALDGSLPALRGVSSPRHADLLLVVAPIAPKLVPSVLALAQAIPPPARVLLVGATGALESSADMLARDLFPGAPLVVPDVRAVLAAAVAAPALRLPETPASELPTLSLPSQHDGEIATERAVLSLGPLQPFTAGPLRLWLICDGEQIDSCQVEAGYAARDIAGQMQRATWHDAAHLAAQLDPLAPVAGRLSYVRAIEQVQHWAVPASVEQARTLALAVERAQNALWWAVSFLRLLAAPTLVERAAPLARWCDELAATLWPAAPAEWLAPQGGAPIADARTCVELERLAARIARLERGIRTQPLLRLRTRDLGRLSSARLAAAGVSGPALVASQQAAGDAQSRLLLRLSLASGGLRAALAAYHQGADAAPSAAGMRAGDWDVPPGEAEGAVEGPRGRLAVRIQSDGGTRPRLVAWQRPSARCLPLLPELLAGQKLADAEVIVASLDLAMAEVDG